MNKLLAAVTLSMLYTVSAQAQGGARTPSVFRCKDNSHIIELSLNNSGETVEGPICAQIVVNALRYYADFGKTTTYSAGPNLTSIFPSSFSPGGGVTVAQLSLEMQFRAYETRIEQISALLLAIQGRNRTAATHADRYLSNLKALINQSDDILITGGPAAVLALVSSPDAKSQMDAALNERDNWNPTDELVDQIRALQTSLGGLAAKFPNNTGAVTNDPCGDANVVQLGWNDWYSKCRESRYKLAEANSARLLTDAMQLTSDSDKAVQFAKKLGIVQYWKNVAVSLTLDSFTRQTEITCGLLFNKNKQTALKLLLADRTSTFDGQTPQPQNKDNLLIVECGSPFSISAGVAFSTIRNREFAVVKSAPTTAGGSSVSQFGTTADSPVHPLPIGMAHVRVWDSSNHQYGLHFSFGVAANIKGQNSGGSDAEFLTGLSMSFLRTIYLTGGLHIGKQAELAGGFKVRDPVPPDVTTAPITNSYKPGFGFAITFTKP